LLQWLIVLRKLDFRYFPVSISGLSRLRIERARTTVNCRPIAWRRLNAGFNLAGVCACLSRLLLLLAAIEVVTMPLTQHLWTWDRFLHGGQDFELGMLMVVTCLCFVLLRAQHSRQRIGWLLAMGTYLLLIFQRRRWSSFIHFGWLADVLPEALDSSPGSFRSLPLLI
jgi:hypothetical protein